MSTYKVLNSDYIKFRKSTIEIIQTHYDLSKKQTIVFSPLISGSGDSKISKLVESPAGILNAVVHDDTYFFEVSLDNLYSQELLDILKSLEEKKYEK
jgi:hypothetical protein